MFYKTMFLNAIWLTGAFGIALVAGIQTTQESGKDVAGNKNPIDVPPSISAPAKRSSNKVDSQKQTTIEALSEKLDKPLAQKQDHDIQLPSSHTDAIHQGLGVHQNLNLACKSCHRIAPDSANRTSPHFLGLPNAKDSEKIDTAFLGIHASKVPTALRKHLKLEKELGAIVDSVVDESPAYHCGLETFDIIVAIDQQPVSGEQELLKFVRSRNPGTKILIEFIRAGQRESCKVVLGKSKVAQMLQSFRIAGCPATLNATTNCRDCHSAQ